MQSVGFFYLVNRRHRKLQSLLPAGLPNTELPLPDSPPTGFFFALVVNWLP